MELNFATKILWLWDSMLQDKQKLDLFLCWCSDFNKLYSINHNYIYKNRIKLLLIIYIQSHYHSLLAALYKKRDVEL